MAETLGSLHLLSAVFRHSIEAHFASSPHRAMSLYDTVVVGCSVVVRPRVHLVLRDLELEIVTSLQ